MTCVLLVYYATKQDEWKSFIKAIGEMIDARFKTFEINLKSYIKDEIKASEARIRKDMATKDDIRIWPRKTISRIWQPSKIYKKWRSDCETI